MDLESIFFINPSQTVWEDTRLIFSVSVLLEKKKKKKIVVHTLVHKQNLNLFQFSINMYH